MKKFLIAILLILMPVVAQARTLVFPHLVVNSAWSFGIALTNTADTDDLVRVETWNEIGIIDSRLITIPAHDRWMKGGYSLEEGLYTIIVRLCSDYTFGTLIRLWKDMPVGEESAQIVPYTPDLQTYNKDNPLNWVMINPASYYTKAGKCPFMGRYHWIRLKEILKEMYLRYEGVKGIDPRPSLGDANDKP